MQDNENIVLKCKCSDGNESSANSKWVDDTIQFARLLAKIVATQDTLNIKAIADEMDVSIEDVHELFERAEQVGFCQGQNPIGFTIAEPHQANEVIPKVVGDTDTEIHCMAIPVISANHMTEDAIRWLEDGCDSSSNLQALINDEGYLLKIPLDEESIGGHECFIDIRGYFEEMESCVHDDCVWVKLINDGHAVAGLSCY